MKRFVMLLLICLLLAGCAAAPAVTTAPPKESQQPTQPLVPWIETAGIPWNEDGSLMELPLTIPDALHYNTARAFDGDLLLWSIDSHLPDINTLELCLIELDTGTVAVEKEIALTGFTDPQILGDRIFLCDSYSGTILELNKELEIVNSWNTEPRDASWTMGSGGILYIYDWNGNVTRLDLNTGVETPLVDGEVYVDYFNVIDDQVFVEYYMADSVVICTKLLNLNTGEILDPPMDGQLNNIFYQNGVWLMDTYRDSYIAYVCTDSGEVCRAELGYETLNLLDDGVILRSREDGCTISLHDPTGAAVAQTTITSDPYSYTAHLLIPSQRFGGYFVLITDYSSSMRLLYWDSSVSTGGEDIPFAPIPEPSEQEAALRQRVKDLQQTYGLSILVGEDAETIFFDFCAEHVTDWELIDDTLDTLEKALQTYPEGFFRQLRYDTIRGVEIHLVGNLSATTEEYVDTYEAFVQYEYDRFVMGVDVYLVREQTYYHEFSHMIDSFLEWDASVREDALFSEDAWIRLNPDWFPGYSYDYSYELFLSDDSSFIDSYSTINPTEDRARVMEYATLDYYDWAFSDRSVLRDKLDYYCRCIRDAFDTENWPEVLPWEIHLGVG